MSKKVTFNAKPTAKAAASADSWVESRTTAEIASAPESEVMKRLTFDIPETLHRQIKTQCASRGTKMADELRLLLEKHYANQVPQA